MEDAIKLGYIAGIIDGEGSIMLVGARHKSFMKLYNRKYPGYYPNVRVGMIHREPLDLIVSYTGIGKIEKEKSYANKRPMYRWRLTRKQEIYDFLKLVGPHLIEKREQAKLLLEYIENNACCHRYNPITPEIAEWRRSYWIKMRTLNGIASPATTEPFGKRGRSKSVRLETTV